MHRGRSCFRKGPVAARKTPAHLVARSQHNSNVPLLSTVPLEVRTLIFREVLGNNDIHIHSVYEAMVIDENGNDHTHGKGDFALLLVCRQIYDEAKDQLYSANDFVFHCRHYRDAWVAYRTAEQLAAVRMVKTQNAFIFDSINMSGMGGCQAWCQNQCSGNSALTMPFSMLFPKLKRIGIIVDYGFGDCAYEDIKHLAEQAGMSDWKDFVKMKERAGIQVAVVAPISDLKLDAKIGRKFEYAALLG